jgi:hypothetical protein
LTERPASRILAGRTVITDKRLPHRHASFIMRTSKALLSLPLVFALSAASYAKNEVTLVELAANPQAYEGKDIALLCILRSADLASVVCEQGTLSVALGSRTMDKASLKFSLANCAKPNASANDHKCLGVLVTARLKSASNPRWLDNAKFKPKGK